MSDGVSEKSEDLVQFLARFIHSKVEVGRMVPLFPVSRAYEILSHDYINNRRQEARAANLSRPGYVQLFKLIFESKVKTSRAELSLNVANAASAPASHSTVVASTIRSLLKACIKGS